MLRLLAPRSLALFVFLPTILCRAQEVESRHEVESRQLVGIWALEENANRGQLPAKPAAEDGEPRLVILDTGEYFFRAKARYYYGGSLTLGPVSSPTSIDFKNTLVSGSGKPWTDLAVYELNSDTLTISKAIKGADRPTSLAPGANVIVQKWRRLR